MNARNILLIFVLAAGNACGQSQTPNQMNKEEHSTKQYPISKSEAEWKNQLSDLEYEVLRKSGTERAFTGKFNTHKESGVYTCRACDTPLFDSDTKYDSGSGWPSFYDVISKGNVQVIVDKSHGMIRSEVRCAQCGGHLGHVFDDGPNPTGLRYCINSVSLDFKKE